MNAVNQVQEASAVYAVDQHALLKSFDLVATAPEGVARLRELILSLAVQGKLVPQDPRDEPASILLERIRAEKQALIKAGKLKKDKPLAEIAEEEKPFELPQGWEWLRLGGAMEMLNGRAFKPSEWLPEGLPIVRIQNLNNPSAPFNCCDPETVDEKNIINNGEFLISWSGTPGTSFGAFIWRRGKAALNQHIFKCVLMGQAFQPEYLELAINSQLSVLISQAQGGVGLQHVTKGTLENLVLTLPPLAEQSRIVACVEELMQICDALEQQGKLEALQHARLVGTLLDALANSESAHALAENWQRVVASFDLLLDRPEAVDALEQTLLQLAVRGLLVPQDPNEEPASELLKKIRTEKDHLIATGKLKRDKLLPDISEEEKPFELPQGWEFVRLNQLLMKIGAGSTPLGGKDVYVAAGVKFLRSQNVWNEGLRLNEVAYIKEETHQKMAATTVVPNDLLFNITGASIGRCAAVPEGFDEANVSQHVTIIRPALKALNPFLHLVLISKHVQQTVMDVQVGVSREGLSIGKLGQFVIPLPPLAEQSRIVARVAELRQLCADLRARLTAARTTQTRLAEALVEQGA